MGSILRELLAFICNPVKQDFNTLSKQNIPFYLFKVFILLFIAQVIVNAFIGTPIKLISNLDYHSLQSEKFVELLREKSVLFLIAFACIIAPVYEEVNFRLGLSFKRIHVLISLCVAAAFVAYQSQSLLLLIILSVVVLFACVFVKNHHLLWYKKYLGNVTIYIAIIVFALAHIPNITLPNLSFWYIYIPYILILLIDSIVFAFVRLRVNFFSSVAIHSIGNVVALFFVLISYYLE